jgi:aldose 1-epimerase
VGSSDRYALASFPLLPWSNRISNGGFEYDGFHHPVKPNRVGEPYPTHGDGWLQPWIISPPRDDTVEMSLISEAFDGNPYAYRALQCFVLIEGGMDQMLTVTRTGIRPLPYGLGEHPFFLRSANTCLTTSVQGVWLSGKDPLPTVHTTEFPESWKPRRGMDVNGTWIDNAYAGWSGEACISWPEHQPDLPFVLNRCPIPWTCSICLRCWVCRCCVLTRVSHPRNSSSLPVIAL